MTPARAIYDVLVSFSPIIRSDAELMQFARAMPIGHYSLAIPRWAYAPSSLCRPHGKFVRDGSGIPGYPLIGCHA
jgi:hypothetical protein